MIDISKLKTFVTVADLGSFSKASEILYITQPAVTQQIKALEKTIGAKLFQRQGGKMCLTEEGKRIYEIAKLLLGSYEGLMEEIAKIKKDLKDSLFLGVSATPSEYIIPTLIAEFHREFPSATVKIFTGNSHDVEEGLISGVLNLGIIEREPSGKFVSVPWLEDEIVFFTYPQNPIADAGEIEPEDLYHIDLVMREMNSGTRKIVKETLEKLGIVFEKLNIKIEANNSRTILHIVKSGYGSSFLSKGLMIREIERGQVVPVKIKGFKVKRRFNIIYPKTSNITFLASNFVKFIMSKTQENIPEHV
ncbi:DNA-binding transcriptional LysR family regulator [Hydrogenivirga caldilitoris]|uniref:DNA-binding transcriptional LysR family regulator n=1 Tax=Hydrogenivirga caldilitoris TaxID=246264 RepID=A0A497XW98_9AQUI|nr:LysR family transcriptional regulator [Hydrogenivirga caldilitoris]RLJ71432.1 DNA-binding transcriptional LysR family regulator [Hydrogenivirga caldilitoris]